MGKDARVREYEIGSEAWLRERIEQGLDPGEGDRPEGERLLRVEFEFAGPAGEEAYAYSAWSTPVSVSSAFG
jgi:hypothetical protein